MLSWHPSLFHETQCPHSGLKKSGNLHLSKSSSSLVASHNSLSTRLRASKLPYAFLHALDLVIFEDSLSQTPRKVVSTPSSFFLL